MDVCMLESEGLSYYSSQVYKNARQNRYGINLSRVRYATYPGMGAALSFSLQTVFGDLGKYDIIHNMPAYAYYGIRWKGQAMVTTAHEFQGALYPNIDRAQSRTSKDALWSRLVVRESIRGILDSDYIIANSSQTQNEAVKLGYDRRKIFVAELGIDSSYMARMPTRKAGKGFKVGFIGMLSPRKNVQFTIRAFRKLADQHVRLELWGRSLYGNAELAEMIGDDKRIAVKGFVPEGKLVQTYDTFDAFVYPSLYEGFGLPILEAKARGLPVIIYKHGHIPEEVRRYCFEAKDEEHMAQIIQELKQNGYNEKLKKKAVEYSRGFTWKKTAEKTLKAYIKIESA